MANDPSLLSGAAPDRLFTRVTGLVLGAGLATVLATHALIDRAQDRQGAAAELAMVATEEAAAARGVVVALDRLAALPEGEADRPSATRLAWDLNRLLALDARRRGLTPGLRAAHGPIDAVAAAAESAPVA